MDKNETNGIDYASRCAGAILGTAFGDALGAAVEGWESADISAEHGEVRDFIESRLGAGCYTDDTQMTLATARSLVRRGRVDGADCAASCAGLFDPERGYGRSATALLKELAAGADYTKTGSMLFPEGSFGNGAAMRIAPVGLLYGAAEPGLVRQQVCEAVRATHVHDEAIDGATLVAVAIGQLSRTKAAALPDSASYLQELAPLCRTMEMRSKVVLAARFLEEETGRADVVAMLGNGVRTLASVPTALYTAMKYLHQPEQALVEAVAYGGDTDTIAAMTGALVGALNGADAFPRRWHDGLERGADGYEALVEVSHQLAKMMACPLPH